MAELKLIDLKLLDDHKQNPRVVFRDDVIDAIAANLNGEWPKKHALSVRPSGDRYEILSGHTRKRAAEKTGIKRVWCWVDDMSDADAYMELVTSNSQGELSPLEIGLHCLRCESLSKGGRGKKGGLSQYAERVGKSHQYVTQVRHAAEVLSDKPASQLAGFLDKTQHLSAIHALPKSCWPGCVEWLATHTMTVEKVQSQVKEAKELLKWWDIDKQWKTYLDKYDCAVAVFSGTHKAGRFASLASLATDVLEGLEEHEDLAGQWVTWLETEDRKETWDIAKVQAKRVELETIRIERDEEPPVDTVSVLLADPPWQYDFSETSTRQIEKEYPTATVDEICQHIHESWVPPIAEDAVLFLWATAPKLREALKVMKEWGFEYKTQAVWDKGKIGMGYWFRGQHELLLVGTRGEISPPKAGERVSSVFREDRTKHSKKPECVYTALEAMFPNANRFEMYQRQPRKGWGGGGLDSK